MLNQIVALEFNDKRIKICQVTHGARGFEVSLFINLGIDADKGSQSSNEECIVSALRKCIASYNITPDQVIFGLPTRSAMLRNIHFPFTDLNKINRVYAFEVEESLPCPLHDVLSDFYVIRSAKTKGVDLIVALILEKTIENNFHLLTDAGLGPQAITLNTIGLANLYSQSLGKDSPGPDMVIDIGQSYSLIVVMENSKVLFTREISIGGDYITHSIQNNCNVEYQEAEHMKLHYGIETFSLARINDADKSEHDNEGENEENNKEDNHVGDEEGHEGSDEECNEGEIEGYYARDNLESNEEDNNGGYEADSKKSDEECNEEETEWGNERDDEESDTHDNEDNQVENSIMQSLSHISDQINLTLASFNEASHKNISRILLTGGTSQMQGIDAYLEKQLGIKVELFRPFKNMKVRYGMMHYQNQEALMAVPCGLCLKSSRSYKKIGRAWDFARGKYYYHKKHRIAEEKIGILSGFIFFILVLGVLGFGVKYNISKNKIEDIERLKTKIFLEAFPGENIPKNIIAFIENKLLDEKNKLKAYKSFLGYQPSCLEILRELSEKISDQYKVRIEDFHINDDKFNLKGNIESYDLLDKMKAALNNSPYFNYVKVEEAKIKRKGKDINFNLEIGIKVRDITIK
ncbi:MAG: pilus assembly protein PilM [bacterium]